MRIIEIAEHIHLIDLELAGISSFIGSYVLKGKNTAIVETGPASTIQSLLTGLEKLDVEVKDVAYVAVSHVHLDHGGGAGTLLKYLPKARLIVHQRGAPHVVNPEKLWNRSREALGSIAEMYGRPELIPKKRVIAATDNMVLNVGDNVELKVMETLGHASHHLIFLETSSQGVFTGDAAGIYLNEIDVVVPTTPAPYRLDIALASLQKIADLKPEFLYYSHFGKTHNSIERLQDYVNQLKLWAEIAREGMGKGEDLERISRRIIEGDVALQKAEGFIRNHPVLCKTVLNQSVEGIMRFVQKSLDSLG